MKIMSNRINTIDYFSPNLRNDELYKFFAVILDKGLSEYYYPEMDAMQQLYNPGSESYDPNYIIELLGGTSLSALISKLENKVAVSVMLPALYDLKGTKEGLETILKMINLEYQNIIYLRGRDGRTKVTIILKDGSVATDDEIKLLQQLANEMLPVCLTLTGVTNCSSVKNELGSTGDPWSASIGEHTLSTDFRLDRSILGRSQGYTAPGSDVATLLCSSTAGDIWVSEDNSLPSINGWRVTVAISELQAMQDDWALSRTLILSRQTPFNFIGVTATGGRGSIDELDLSSEYDITEKRQSYCYGVFVPGFSIMGRDANRLSHNATQRISSNALDEGKISRTVILSRNQVTHIKVCATNDHNWPEDIELLNTLDETSVDEAVLRSNAADIGVDQEYFADHYNEDYMNDGILGNVTGSHTVAVLSDIENDFFNSMEMTGYSASISQSLPEYDNQIDVETIHEARAIVGLYTQFDYDELDYKV